MNLLPNYLLFILITLVTNVIVCAVLLAPNMRSPTNILLVAIATSDVSDHAPRQRVTRCYGY